MESLCHEVVFPLEIMATPWGKVDLAFNNVKSKSILSLIRFDLGHASDQGSSLLILMCHSGDYSQSDAVRGVVSVQENGSWEEPHDLNGLWPWRLWPLKLK